MIIVLVDPSNKFYVRTRRLDNGQRLKENLFYPYYYHGWTIIVRDHGSYIIRDTFIFIDNNDNKN